MKHVFICGAKSIGQYGGYETFVQELARHMEKFRDIQLHIFCKANGSGSMDESALEKVTEMSQMEFMYCGAHCIKLEVPRLGAATAIWYDAAAVKYALHYCEEQGIREPIFYILTCRIGPYINRLKQRMRQLDGEFELNPDGHEWKRRKWPLPVRKYWKWSEKKMVQAADLVICDSLNIEKYIQKSYRDSGIHTTYISYGADVPDENAAEDSAAFSAYMQRHELTKDDYYLVVCRFVPENNIEIILREFMHSSTTRKLAVVTTENSKYQKKLEKKLHFERDRRICLLGEIYDQGLLKSLRINSWAYLHGHEVGGTNPSLLESLGTTRISLLLQVPFNEEVALDAALYWTKEPGNLASLIDKADTFSEKERLRLGTKAKERVKNNYSWEKVAKAYRELWSSASCTEQVLK